MTVARAGPPTPPPTMMMSYRSIRPSLWRGFRSRPTPLPLAVAHQLEEFLARPRVVPHHPQQARGGQPRARGVDPAHGHAAVLGDDHHADALGLQDVLDGVGDLRRQLLLDLQPAGEAV